MPKIPDTRAKMQTEEELGKLVWQNWVKSPSFTEESFLGVLHGKGRWDADLYWPLDKVLFALAEGYAETSMPKKLIEALLDIYSYAYGRLNWHRMQSDRGSVSNLTDATCGEWAERVELVFKAALCGKSVNNTHFQYVNPMLEESAD